MKKILFLVFVLVFPYFISAQAPGSFTTARYYVSDVRDCLTYEGYERGGMGMILHFKNVCEYNLYAIACVTYSNGTMEISKSSSRIPRKGRWNISFFEGNTPKTVDWTASLYNTQLPNSCKVF